VTKRLEVKDYKNTFWPHLNNLVRNNYDSIMNDRCRRCMRSAECPSSYLLSWTFSGEALQLNGGVPPVIYITSVSFRLVNKMHRLDM